MTKTLRGTYQAGTIELFEPLELPDGSEIVVSVTTPESARAPTDPTAATAGAWAELLDCEAFERDVYGRRLLSTPPDP